MTWPHMTPPYDTPEDAVTGLIEAYRTPDVDKIVTGVEVWGPNVGLLFRGAEEHEIPVLSEIEFVAA